MSKSVYHRRKFQIVARGGQPMVPPPLTTAELLQRSDEAIAALMAARGRLVKALLEKDRLLLEKDNLLHELEVSHDDQ